MHAIARARERYGVELTRESLAALAKQCRNGRSVLVADFGCRSVHLVDHSGTVMKVVYAPTNDVIVTFLAREHRKLPRPGIAKRKRHYGGRKKT